MSCGGGLPCCMPESSFILNAQLQWIFVGDGPSGWQICSTDHYRLLFQCVGDEGMLSSWGEFVILHCVDLLFCLYIDKVSLLFLYCISLEKLSFLVYLEGQNLWTWLVGLSNEVNVIFTRGGSFTRLFLSTRKEVLLKKKKKSCKSTKSTNSTSLIK